MEKEKEIYTGDIPNTPIRFLRYMSAPYKRFVWSATTIVAINAAAGAFTFLFIKEIIDSAQAGDTERVVSLGLLYPTTIFIIHTIWRATGYLGLQWIGNVRKDTYDALVKYTHNHSDSYFADRFAGSLLSKVNNIVGAGDKLISDFLWHHVEVLVSFIASFVVIALVDVETALLFLALVLSLGLLNYKLIGRKRALSKGLAESETLLRGQIVDVFSNVGAVRQFARKDYEYHSLQNTTSDNRSIFDKSWMYSEWMRILNSVVLFAFMIFMFWILSQRWVTEEVTTGEFVAIVTLMFNVSHTMIFLGRIFNDTAKSYGEMEEGLEEIMIDHEIKDSSNAKKLQVQNGSITYQAVTFAYQKEDIFKRLSLNIQPGQRVGLVGPSGAGKSTFVSLLLRQHDIQYGQIMIDGQNIAEVTQDSLRENIALVPQEPMLFHRTIRENIMYGKPDATEEEMVLAATRAQAHEFINQLPDKYETLVGERGVKLSGGQKQRVAIARAMLKEAPLLVLDEATSALDSESEVAIQQALEELMEGKTVIAVAHRLSTLRKMDRILVFENGKIIEDGSHDELAAGGGLYAKLWEHQAGGFIK